MTNQLTLLEGASIETYVFGDGIGGDIFVTANSIRVEGYSAEFNSLGLHSSIRTFTIDRGEGGNVEIGAGNLVLSDGAEISSSNFSSSQGGNVKVDAGDVLIEGVRSFGLFYAPSTISSASLRSGIAGDISVDANNIKITGGASIATTALGVGDAGRLSVSADSLIVNGVFQSQSFSLPSFVISSAFAYDPDT